MLARKSLIFQSVSFLKRSLERFRGLRAFGRGRHDRLLEVDPDVPVPCSRVSVTFPVKLYHIEQGLLRMYFELAIDAFDMGFRGFFRYN